MNSSLGWMDSLTYYYDDSDATDGGGGWPMAGDCLLTTNHDIHDTQRNRIVLFCVVIERTPRSTKNAIAASYHFTSHNTYTQNDPSLFCSIWRFSLAHLLTDLETRQETMPCRLVPSRRLWYTRATTTTWRAVWSGVIWTDGKLQTSKWVSEWVSQQACEQYTKERTNKRRPLSISLFP